MIKFTTYLRYNKYINELLKNQNDTPVDWLQNQFSKKDYQNILRPVLEVIAKYPNASLTTLRLKLFEESKIKDLVTSFVHETRITPGVLLDFGTFNTRDTILCGNSQEYIMRNGILVPEEKRIEQDTIFDLASTSKLFTAIAIIKLAEDQYLDLFEPVKKYIPEFKNLEDTTIYDLLKFRVKVVTDKRIDSTKDKEIAKQILFTAHPVKRDELENAYTDIGAMILRYVVEKVSKIPFELYVELNILSAANMHDTYLQVPMNKLNRVANENYSTVINADGTATTKCFNIPGTPHDSKAIAIGELEGIAPGHAGWFSTKDDMTKFAKALIDGKIIAKDNLLKMSDTTTGVMLDDGFTRCYGSLVYLKQNDEKYLAVHPALSGRAFMSPGFAGTTLIIDPLNELTLFIASPRLHNRIYRIHPNQAKNIKVYPSGKKTFILPNGEEKIVCSDFAREKEVLIKLATKLALQYQLLEKIYPSSKEMHLVRELY